MWQAVCWFLDPDVFGSGILLLILLTLIYGVYQHRKQRVKEIVEVVDDPLDYVDDQIIAVKFGQQQEVHMTGLQFREVWQPMTREQKRKYLDKYAKLIKGTKRK